MDIPTKKAEQLADAARAERKARRAASRAITKPGQTRIGNLANIARGAGLGGLFGKLPK